MRSTTLSPENVEQTQVLRKTPLTAGASTNTKGLVKRLSAHFETLDKQDIETEGRYKLLES